MTDPLPPDPLAANRSQGGGIAEFAKRLRRGEITCEAASEAYLARIAALDGALGAYQHVAAESALRQARALDALLAAGTDLGPLMGVPIAVKDIFAVAGMPTTSGSRIDVADIVGAEGSFVKRLKSLGCVILGKLKTVEFALGGTGTNYHLGTPRNPWDAATRRVAAGSSSGAGVAMAAGLCGFAVGSDTGGSVRGPAAFCGVVGVKTTAGLWPTDGVFPLSRTLDTIGPLCRSAADAAAVMAALAGEGVPPPAPLRGVRLGRPAGRFFEGAGAEVRHCLDAALADLARAGAEIVDFALPAPEEVGEGSSVYPTLARPELIAAFGRGRFEASLSQMNPDVAERAAAGLAITGDAYVRAAWHHRELIAAGHAAMEGLDAWLAPGKWQLAAPDPGGFKGSEAEAAFGRQCAGPTRAVNLMGMCATSQPVQQYGAALPVGLQIVCRGFDERKLMALALAVEAVVGPPPTPDLSGFLA